MPTPILFCSHSSMPTQNQLTTFSPLLDTCPYSLWHWDHFHIFQSFKAICSREDPQNQWYWFCKWRVSNLGHRIQGYIRVLKDLTRIKNHGRQDNPPLQVTFSRYGSPWDNVPEYFNSQLLCNYKNNPLDTCVSVLLVRITAGIYKINSALEI